MDYNPTPEDIAADKAEQAWKERQREKARRVLLERIERDRRAAVGAAVDALVRRFGGAA